MNPKLYSRYLKHELVWLESCFNIHSIICVSYVFYLINYSISIFILVFIYRIQLDLFLISLLQLSQTHTSKFYV